MSNELNERLGIVGGYGATGSAVVTALLKSCDGEVMIGGRDLNKGMTSAAKLGSRVSATHLDALHADQRCGQCLLQEQDAIHDVV